MKEYRPQNMGTDFPRDLTPRPAHPPEWQVVVVTEQGSNQTRPWDPGSQRKITEYQEQKRHTDKQTPSAA